ncbi:MAG: hypothetical protein LC753_13585 [Acidobacteria bacterium]|nr:hypothetical protein [Acidobacteriota bacterium]MCA1651255.1 hypothetical protein [Acidobacteriota bacterium]
MKRAVSLLTALMILVAASRPVQASTPAITAQIFGIELCPQFICGAAIFTGVLAGQVGNNPYAFGTFTVAITHEELPQVAGQQADLTGGVFEIRVGWRRFRGDVSSGTLTKNANNSFTVQAVLTIQRGGSGDMNFLGTLDHTVFPPTISGFIYQ